MDELDDLLPLTPGEQDDELGETQGEKEQEQVKSRRCRRFRTGGGGRVVCQGRNSNNVTKRESQSKRKIY